MCVCVFNLFCFVFFLLLFGVNCLPVVLKFEFVFDKLVADKPGSDIDILVPCQILVVDMNKCQGHMQEQQIAFDKRWCTVLCEILWFLLLLLLLFYQFIISFVFQVNMCIVQMNEFFFIVYICIIIVSFTFCVLIFNSIKILMKNLHFQSLIR